MQHLTVSPLKEVTLDRSGTSEETTLKQCYTQSTYTVDCAQRLPSQENVNISTRQLYKLHLITQTPYTLNWINQQQTGILIHLPSSIYIGTSQKISSSRDYSVTLTRMKCSLKKCAVLKFFEEFPFGPGNELKRRKTTKGGESVVMQLCSNIFVLTSVMNGTLFDDLKAVLILRKYTSINDSVCVEQCTPNPGFANKSRKNNTELSLIQNMLSSVQADIIAIKQDNKELRDEIHSIKKYIKVLKTGVSEYVESTAKSINEINMSIDRVTDTSYNSASSVKNDLYSFNETLSVNMDNSEKPCLWFRI